MMATGAELAIDGGVPVRSEMLPYARQWVNEDDIAAVVEVLRSDWLTTGPTVESFEQAIAETVGAREAVAVSSGTAALHAAAFAADLAPGDEAIVPAMTFAASANCILYMGARPVFADVRTDTLNVDPESVEARLTGRTRAIVAVDYAGQPADLAELRSLADARGITLIEDAAHALGATYRDHPIGSVSPLTAFSFHPVKHITTAEGGAVACDRRTVAQRLRRFRNHGISADHRERAIRGEWTYEIVDLGYNYRLSDVGCALGLSQLARLPSFLERRRQIAGAYRAAFGDLDTLRLVRELPDREAAWHLFPVRLELARLRADRRQVFSAMRAEGIGVNVHFIPVYWHPYYERLGYARGACPVAEAAYEQLLTLPLFPAMTDEDVSDVISAVQKVMSAYRR